MADQAKRLLKLALRLSLRMALGMTVTMWATASMVWLSGIINPPNSHFAIYSDPIGITFSYGFSSFSRRRPLIDFAATPADRWENASWEELFETWDDPRFTTTWATGHPDVFVFRTETEFNHKPGDPRRHATYRRGRIGVCYLPLIVVLIFVNWRNHRRSTTEAKHK